ncbi:MAG: PEPxxWA-CTERM sorting domain-containing protein [Sphingomonas sp.]
MRKTILAASWLLPFALAATPSHAATVMDATGDFLPTYVGPLLADLDVTSFSVNYNSGTSIFTLGATFAGAIDPSTVGFYIFGVNTGTGTARPFAALGQGNVIFNQAITIRKDGTGQIGATVLSPADISIAGNILTFKIAASLMPSTGFNPENYGFNLWPRIGTGNNNQITDFAPENATLAAAPEPATWAMMIIGFGGIGGVLRTRRRNAGLATG